MKRKTSVLFISLVILASLLALPVQASPDVVVRNVFPWNGVPTTISIRLPQTGEIYYATVLIYTENVNITVTVRVRRQVTSLCLNVDKSLKDATVVLLSPEGF